MHLPTHILSGWCAGNLLPLTARERLGCMIAATAADLDGLGRFWSEQAYWDYHHLLGHNFLAAGVIAGALVFLSPRRRWAGMFVIYLLLAHLHLVLDYLGSGPQWPIHYLWPFSKALIRNRDGWEFASWQNFLAFGVLVVWMIVIAVRHRRTPLELIAPRFDRAIVERIARPAKMNES